MTVTCRQMLDTEEAAFARGVTAGALMETAGSGIAAAFLQFYPHPGHAVLYLGKGNNAGDALVAARYQLASGWSVHARLSCEPAEFKPLPAGLWQELKDRITVFCGPSEVEALRGRVVLIDGLVGIGSQGVLRGKLAELVVEMNGLRQTRHASVVALDLPSGLNPVSGEAFEPCVEADITITVAHVKTALLEDAATPWVGRLATVPVPELGCAEGDTDAVALTSRVLLPGMRARNFDTHKGQMGRVGVIAGSKGYLGAAELCATAALRGGAGLVTIYVKEEIYPVIATRMPSEIMVKMVEDYREVLDEPADVLAVGPGLGRASEEEILAIVSQAEKPLVLDADALNILARHGFDCLRAGKAPRLLTPHPGEMARLAERMPEWKRLTRAETVRAFGKTFPMATLLLKGARTVIGAAGRPVAFNTTGHPGMATGGMGDVLTGICSALIAGGATAYDAACIGSWINGRAAEIAISSEAVSAESLSAGVVLDYLGHAFHDLRQLGF